MTRWVLGMILVAACAKGTGQATEEVVAHDPPATSLPAISQAAAAEPANAEPVEPSADGEAALTEGEQPARETPGTAAALPLAEDAGASVVADSATLYAGCEQRVEGRESDGECTTDAECGTAGCSSEVCLPAATAGEVMTSCEVQPCFAVLDSCGCQAGRCKWTLK